MYQIPAARFVEWDFNNNNNNQKYHFNLSDVGWFQRRTACANSRSITITEGAQGTINLKSITGVAKQVEKTIVLGEEHSELLPNGQEVKVTI